jgi:hypothetical protein
MGVLVSACYLFSPATVFRLPHRRRDGCCWPLDQVRKVGSIEISGLSGGKRMRSGGGLRWLGTLEWMRNAGPRALGLLHPGEEV